MGRTYLLVAVAAVLWGINFNMAKPVTHDMHPLLAGAVRFALAAALMWAYVLWQGLRVPLRRHAGAYLLLGAVGIGGFNLFFFLGLQVTSPVNGALIMATSPLVTSFLAALFLGERLTRTQLLAMPVALAGVAVVVLGGGAGLHLSFGDALMFGANFSWSLYTVMGRRLMPAQDGVVNITGIMTGGALVMAVTALGVGTPLTMPGLEAGAALVFMTVGGAVLAYLFWNRGVAQLGAARTSLFMNLVPVATMITATVTGAPPNAVQMIGAVLVLVAVSAPMLPWHVLRPARL